MIDRYTKVVLTVIAACLVVIAGRGLMPDHAIAQLPTRVVVDSVASYALQYAGPLEVRCSNCK